MYIMPMDNLVGFVYCTLIILIGIKSHPRNRTQYKEALKIILIATWASCYVCAVYV